MRVIIVILLCCCYCCCCCCCCCCCGGGGGGGGGGGVVDELCTKCRYFLNVILNLYFLTTSHASLRTTALRAVCRLDCWVMSYYGTRENRSTGHTFICILRVICSFMVTDFYYGVTKCHSLHRRPILQKLPFTWYCLQAKDSVLLICAPERDAVIHSSDENGLFINDLVAGIVKI